MLSDWPGPSSVLHSIGGGGPSFLSPLFPTSSEDSNGDPQHTGNRKDHRDYRRKAGKQGKQRIERRRGIVKHARHNTAAVSVPVSLLP